MNQTNGESIQSLKKTKGGGREPHFDVLPYGDSNGPSKRNGTTNHVWDCEDPTSEKGLSQRGRAAPASPQVGAVLLVHGQLLLVKPEVDGNVLLLSRT